MQHLPHCIFFAQGPPHWQPPPSPCFRPKKNILSATLFCLLCPAQRGDTIACPSHLDRFLHASYAGHQDGMSHIFFVPPPFGPVGSYNLNTTPNHKVWASKIRQLLSISPSFVHFLRFRFPDIELHHRHIFFKKRSDSWTVTAFHKPFFALSPSSINPYYHSVDNGWMSRHLWLLSLSVVGTPSGRAWAPPREYNVHQERTNPILTRGQFSFKKLPVSWTWGSQGIS